MKRNAATLKKEKEDVRTPAYLEPLSEFGFERILGQELHKDILIDFLNELLKSEEKQIVDLHYKQKEYPSPAQGGHKVILNLTCTNKDGEQFIVGIQKGEQEYFREATILYAFNIIRELGRSEPEWDGRLPEMYFISLMDFRLNDSERGSYLQWADLREAKSRATFYDKLSFVFIEIPSFSKGEEELETGLYEWLYVLKNLSVLDKMPSFFSKTIFQKVFTIAELSKLSKEDYMRYTKEQMARIDRYAILETVKKEGIEIGEEKIIRKLLESGKFSVAEVALYADVSASVVQKVKTSMKKD